MFNVMLFPICPLSMFFTVKFLFIKPLDVDRLTYSQCVNKNSYTNTIPWLSTSLADDLYRIRKSSIYDLDTIYPTYMILLVKSHASEIVNPIQDSYSVKWFSIWCKYKVDRENQYKWHQHGSMAIIQRATKGDLLFIQIFSPEVKQLSRVVSDTVFVTHLIFIISDQ